MNNKPETEFQNAFAQLAQFRGATLETIPDFIPERKAGGGYTKFRAHKRPFDAILATPIKVYCLEFKYQHGSLLPHQENTGRRIHIVNPEAYRIVRKKLLKKGFVYSVETYKKEVEFETGDLLKFVDFFLTKSVVK